MSENSRAIFDAIAGELKADAGAVQGKVFGSTCLKIAGKVFAVWHESDMVFKLSGEQHASALSLDGARLFDPSGMNRPMKEWVQVPSEHLEVWGKLSREALEYVDGRIERGS